MSDQGRINLGLFAMLAMLFAFAIFLVLSVGSPQPQTEPEAITDALKNKRRSANKHMMQLAHLQGDADSVQAIGNYTDTVHWVFTAPDGDWISLDRVIIGISDAAIDNSDEYGALSALANGIQVYLRDSTGALLSTLTPYAITTNGDWSLACHDLSYHTAPANGNDYISVRWTFSRSGYPIIMAPGNYVDITLVDNFTGLIKHQFFFQGYYLDEVY